MLKTTTLLLWMGLSLVQSAANAQANPNETHRLANKAGISAGLAAEDYDNPGTALGVSLLIGCLYGLYWFKERT